MRDTSRSVNRASTGMQSLLVEILQAQLRIHADVQLQDICKLLYQAAFGCEHLAFQVESVEECLWTEYHDPPTFTGREPLVERIDPTNVMCRVNIRPYKAAGGTYDCFRTAFLQSLERMGNGQERFWTLWDALSGLVINHALPFSPEEFKRFEKRHLNNDWLPAFHHSEAFRSANKPCYRVIRIAYLPASLEWGPD